MKREVINTITSIEDSTKIAIKYKADLLGITVTQYLEGADGRAFRIRKENDDICLFSRVAYNNTMKYGEYCSTGFTAGM